MNLTFWIITCASLGGMLYGYDLGVFSGAIYSIKESVKLTLPQIGIAGGAVFMGGLAGTMITGYLSDKFGRRAMIIVGSLLFIIGVLLTLAIHSFYTLIFSRIILGVAVGVISVAVPSYLSEISPTKIRGRSVTIFQLFLTIGILLAYAIDTFLSPEGSFRVMYAVLIIPAVILFITLFFLPESPRWLMNQDKDAEAFHILKITRPEKEAIEDLANMKLSHLNDQKSRWRDLFNRRIALPLALIVLIAVLNQLTAVNAIILYVPYIFTSSGLKTLHSALDASTFIAFINFAATAIGAFIVDKTGRKPLLIFGTAGATLSYLFLGVAAHFGAHPLFTFIGIMCFIFCFASGPGYIVWLILTELLPTGVRSKGLALALFANSLTSWLVTSIFLDIKNTIGMGNTYFILAFFTFLYFLVAWKWVPETSQKSLEQIQIDFSAHPPHAPKKGT